jgi:proteic killer suppression protein
VLIQSFGDKRTERLFNDNVVKEFEGFAARAKRKLESLNAAACLEDLSVPPSNRLEKLRGDRKGFHSIRINDQWRVVFQWVENHAHEVSIVDYH